MTKVVPVSELKARCLRLIEEVATRRRPILVTKRGKPVARVVPLGGVQADEELGGLRGTLVGGDRLADFESPVQWEAGRR
jgi:prevent-host-death family protein